MKKPNEGWTLDEWDEFKGEAILEWHNWLCRYDITNPSSEELDNIREEWLQSKIDFKDKLRESLELFIKYLTEKA